MAVAVFGCIGILLAALALLLSVRDHFTLRRRLAEEQERADECFARLQHLGRMTTEVAHELKNPVTAVVCAAETLDLLLEGQVEEHHRDTLRYIRDYGEYVLSIMGDFIDVSRGVCGEQSSRKERVALDEVLHSVVGLLSPTAGKRGVEIESYVDEERLYVEADRRHVKQILFNLVHNAVKFAREGGEVKVQVHRSSSGTQIIICIKDDGAGIDESIVEGLRAGRVSRSNSADGNGIGLLLTSGLVTLEGGVWDIISNPNEGTTVAVSLPGGVLVKDTTVCESEGVSSETEQPFRGQSVLLVDGDLGTRETVRQLIEALGGVVDGVAEATQAIEAMRSREYSAVLIDEEFIHGTTDELAKMLKADSKGHCAKIVVASRHPGSSDFTPNVDSVIEKPLSKRSLLTSLLPSH